MNAKFEWLDSGQTRLRVLLNEELTNRSLIEMQDVLNVMFAQVDHTVDVIIVFTFREMPPGFIGTLQRFEENVSDNLNRTVLVGGNQMFFKMTRDFMMRFRPNNRLKNHVYIVETEDEALAILDGSIDAEAV